MDLLILAHLVSSYEDWKVIFDEDSEARKAFVSGQTHVGQADAKTAMIVFHGVDMEAMAAFLGAPEFAERTSRFVSGHALLADGASATSVTAMRSIGYAVQMS